MFFLPLPLNKTLETPDQVTHDDSTLPEPQLYIIVNGRPTKSKVVWRSLVDVNKVKAAIAKLRCINWLYKDIGQGSVDTATQHIIEVSNGSITSVLEKATKDDLAEFQAFTIRNLDNKLSTKSDIEQYKLLSVTEDPIDNRQQYLDVMCFPVLCYLDVMCFPVLFHFSGVAKAVYNWLRSWSLCGQCQVTPKQELLPYPFQHLASGM